MFIHIYTGIIRLAFGYPYLYWSSTEPADRPLVTAYHFETGEAIFCILHDLAIPQHSQLLRYPLSHGLALEKPEDRAPASCSSISADGNYVVSVARQSSRMVPTGSEAAYAIVVVSNPRTKTLLYTLAYKPAVFVRTGWCPRSHLLAVRQGPVVSFYDLDSGTKLGHHGDEAVRFFRSR